MDQATEFLACCSCASAASFLLCRDSRAFSRWRIRCFSTSSGVGSAPESGSGIDGPPASTNGFVRGDEEGPRDEDDELDDEDDEDNEDDEELDDKAELLDEDKEDVELLSPQCPCAAWVFRLHRSWSGPCACRTSSCPCACHCLCHRQSSSCRCQTFPCHCQRFSSPVRHVCEHIFYMKVDTSPSNPFSLDYSYSYEIIRFCYVIYRYTPQNNSIQRKWLGRRCVSFSCENGSGLWQFIVRI